MKVKNRKRELTAKEYAEQYEISVRTVKRYFSQDREDYEKEAIPTSAHFIPLSRNTKAFNRLCFASFS